jgi:hypothetical protein
MKLFDEPADVVSYGGEIVVEGFSDPGSVFRLRVWREDDDFEAVRTNVIRKRMTEVYPVGHAQVADTVSPGLKPMRELEGGVQVSRLRQHAKGDGGQSLSLNRTSYVGAVRSLAAAF